MGFLAASVVASASAIASAKKNDNDDEDPDPVVRATKEAAQTAATAATIIHKLNTSQMIFALYYDNC
jgi:hypothetical protein